MKEGKVLRNINWAGANHAGHIRKHKVGVSTSSTKLKKGRAGKRTKSHVGLPIDAPTREKK